jgi:hypothetical protein
MGGRDLELERARFLSLALEFGFDEESANKCLDRLISLYGNSPTQPLIHSLTQFLIKPLFYIIGFVDIFSVGKELV